MASSPEENHLIRPGSPDDHVAGGTGPGSAASDDDGDPDRGRTVVITGAAKRVGQAIALRLASLGCHLHLTWNRSQDEINATADTCRARGAATVTLHRVELGDLDQVQAWAERLASEVPVLHGLVHNASRYVPSPWGGVDAGELMSHYAINAAAPVLITQALDQPLRAGLGSVVAFADIHVMGRPRRHFAAYSLSKAAMVDFVYTLAREMAPEVRVNAIAPGVVAWPPDTPEAEIRGYEKRIPLARSGTPDDAADLVAFLLSPHSRYITGEIIRLDGGRWLR